MSFLVRMCVRILSSFYVQLRGVRLIEGFALGRFQFGGIYCSLGGCGRREGLACGLCGEVGGW